MAELIKGVDFSVVDPSQKWKILRSQSRFALWALWLSSGVIMQGFDITVGGQLAALPAFREKFGRPQPDGSFLLPAYYLSAWNSIAPACEVVATFIFAPLLEKYGRKWGILAASMISVAGILLQQLAQDWTVHLAGRGVNGVAIGMMFTITPLWIGECCRPELRGFFLCFFNTAIVFGQFAIVVVSRGSNEIDGKWQWWTPVVAMYIFPLILTSLWPWFPESTYWLVRQGRPEAAKASLRRIHGFTEEAFYDIELHRLEEEVRVANEIQGSIDGVHTRKFLGVDIDAEAECFRASNRKRTFTAIFCASGQQMIGATFVIGYSTYFFELIGIQDYFNASVALYVVMLLASTAAFPLTEIYGRRFLIVGPQFALCFMLLMVGILGCIPNHPVATGKAIVAFIYVWALIYQLSIGATGFVLASEIATMRLRGATQGLITITNACWGLIMQFTVPYMINRDAGNLGGKVGFIFLGTGLIAAVGGWFLYPETKGIPFEKMDELYAAKVPPRRFGKVVAREREEGGSFSAEKIEQQAKEGVHVEKREV
ncbi:uncharacterized protein LTR77_001931 [Saxophila tyrrhenica]|uniref:Major facilitator superfamily (MFS) profile domain-containing protein n=1 Tax=Saxophila tyrrhenica TaxID=1690608 RepID=A0AAV9PKN9_9PEZI|nr:hypothetical protein LTR77_001931 [Saxophila tyrrhenica]